MSKFEQGKSGNPKGRPTKEEMAIRNMDKSELEKALRKLRPASMEALTYLINAMHNENIPEKDRLKYSKDVWDIYVKALAADAALKRGKAVDSGASDEEEEHAPAPVVFMTVRK